MNGDDVSFEECYFYITKTISKRIGRDIRSEVIDDLLSFLVKNFYSIIAKAKINKTAYVEKVLSTKCNGLSAKIRLKETLSIETGGEDGESMEETFAAEETEETPCLGHEEVWNLVSSLSDYERTVIIDCFFNGKKVSEIARERGMSQQAISKVKVRALKKMRKEIRKTKPSFRGLF
ncbi:MAG: sigma-70 family RNA polymerase sigma factor [Bacilli bacterium]|jgi:RNA polymerase sigma factor (sigma-70 family)|nr:sigma-70 family RNA polymerase sigma factor [Bacilli bacterium]